MAFSLIHNRADRKVQERIMRTSYRYLRLSGAALLGLGLLFVVVGTVSAHVAHAKVLSATPAIGSTITQAPTKVTVFTAENINPDPKLSNLFVYSPAGDLISQGDAKVSLSDPKQMSISIKPGGNGVYVVRRITVSALDGDPDEGAFVFTVKPAIVATPTATSHGSTTTTTNEWNTSLGTHSRWYRCPAHWIGRWTGYRPEHWQTVCRGYYAPESDRGGAEGYNTY